MEEFLIEVKNKIAQNLSPDKYIVCGNSDYKIKFLFDEEWNDLIVKTALFTFNEQTIPVVFSGNVCDVPVINNTRLLAVGIKSGDLKTTTPVYMNCKISISDISQFIQPPSKDVYDQIIELLNKNMILLI